MMYVLHVNKVHEMWQDAARGNLTNTYLFIYLFVCYNLMTSSNTEMP